jgi:hypothetical protein
MHSTSNLEDNYIGSGKRLWLSIRKHGRENHTKEILEFFNDREELKRREKEIVNEQFITDPMCMNLMQGGEGGMSYLDKEIFRKIHKASRDAFSENLRSGTLKNGRDAKEFLSELHKIAHKKKPKSSYGTWKGKHLSEEHRKTIAKNNSQLQKGEKNSQFGKVWIFHEEKRETKAVKREELDSYLLQGWIKGRKRIF